MALRWAEGFEVDGSNAALTMHYTSVGSAAQADAAAARYGSLGLQRGSNSTMELVKELDAQATWIMGFGYRLGTGTPAGSGYTISRLMDATTQQLELRITNERRLTVTRNNTVLATGTTILAEDVYYFVEWKATIADAGGSIEVRINGVTEISFSGDTKNTASAGANRVTLGSTIQNIGAVSAFDDWYVLDGTATTPNDFLGDVKVLGLVPDGAGNYSQWTPSAGSNWQNVDELITDGDTTYNSSSTAGQKDSFTYTGLTGMPTVYGVRHQLKHRKDDAGARTVRPFTRAGGTDSFGSNVTLADSYTGSDRIMGKNPATGVAWTATEVNALEAGYELVS